jgi:hypothetical protein
VSENHFDIAYHSGLGFALFRPLLLGKKFKYRFRQKKVPIVCGFMPHFCLGQAYQ